MAQAENDCIVCRRENCRLPAHFDRAELECIVPKSYFPFHLDVKISVSDVSHII